MVEQSTTNDQRHEAIGFERPPDLTAHCTEHISQYRVGNADLLWHAHRYTEQYQLKSNNNDLVSWHRLNIEH